MNRYDIKQEARRARLLDAAERAEARANAANAKADMREEASGIPFGQPILVGHHSERKHRRAIETADKAMRRSVEESRKAGELRAKAASVGTGGVSSDDPDAIEKLRQNLAARQIAQDMMVAANRVYRAAIKAGATHESDDERLSPWADKMMLATGEEASAATIRAGLTPDFCGRVGFADYQLSNNRAEINRLEQRIRQLEQAGARETTSRDLGHCVYVANAEENRLQFVFDGKPDAETRALLKSHGFRWAPSQGAWQRKWTANGVYAARSVIAALTETGAEA